MEKKVLLVSLLSDQTIPNVQLIKELSQQVSNYFFLSTVGMEGKGVRKWIIAASGIREEDADYREANQFSFSDIRKELDSYDFDIYEKIIVNLTGGTKIMTLVSYEFFQSLGAEILYVTGENEQYIQLFPRKRNNEKKFVSGVSLKNYLIAYGFSIIRTNMSGYSFEQSQNIFNYFSQNGFEQDLCEMELIQSNRNKRLKSIKFTDKLALYLKKLNFIPQGDRTLSSKETKYLSGEWFEEYVGLRIKKELDLDDDNIFIGVKLLKAIPPHSKNDVTTLLGCDLSSEPDNEMDVMFMYKNVLYTVECKSSILTRAYTNNGGVREHERNILGDTIYKSDSLKTRLGLWSKSFIITLTDFKQYCNVEDTSTRNNRLNSMTSLINRANLSNIKLIDKSILESDLFITEITK